MVPGYGAFGVRPFGMPPQTIVYSGATLEVDITLTVAPTTQNGLRLDRGERLIYLAELAPWAVSDRSGG